MPRRKATGKPKRELESASVSETVSEGETTKEGNFIGKTHTITVGGVHVITGRAGKGKSGVLDKMIREDKKKKHRIIVIST